jgi:tetratricopeptide (TPR) repeat protein
MNLGQTLLSLARRLQTPEYYGQALECFDSYLALQKRAGAGEFEFYAMNGIAGIYVDQGRLDEAKAVLLPALESAKKDKTSALSGMTFLNLAAISLKSGRIAEAEALYEQVLAAAKQGSGFLRRSGRLRPGPLRGARRA